MPQHLDRRDELVEVHVQHPTCHASLLPGPAVITTAQEYERLMMRREVRGLDAAGGAVLPGLRAPDIAVCLPSVTGNLTWNFLPVPAVFPGFPAGFRDIIYGVS